MQSITIEQIHSLNRTVYLHDPAEREVIREIAFDFIGAYKNVQISTEKYNDGKMSAYLWTTPDNKGKLHELWIEVRPKYTDKTIRTGPTSSTVVEAYTGQEIEVYGTNTNSYSVIWDEDVEAVQ